MFYNTFKIVKMPGTPFLLFLWGAQVWAHNGPWASLGTSCSIGRGNNIGPIMGPGEAWAYYSPWGAQVWAHNGPKLGTRMDHGGRKVGPIMGPGQAWDHHNVANGTFETLQRCERHVRMVRQMTDNPRHLKNPHQTQKSHKFHQI